MEASIVGISFYLPLPFLKKAVPRKQISEKLIQDFTLLIIHQSLDPAYESHIIRVFCIVLRIYAICKLTYLTKLTKGE